MSAHTPGPWRIGRSTFNDGGKALMAPCAEQETKRIGTIDCQVPTKRGKGYLVESDAERDANARLIAAAPDLLEALEAMYALHTGEHGHEEHAAAQSKALTKAELAIDKALGNE